MLSNSLRNHIAKKHIAGPGLQDALSVCRQAAEKKWAAALSVWGFDKEPDIFTSKCLEVINAISREDIDCYLSIKPGSINFDIKIFSEIATAAGKKNIRIHFDSLTYDLASRSIEFIKKAKFLYSNVGCTLPSGWLRSIGDAEEVAGLKIPVRIVKGQWKDPEHAKINTAENFLEIVNVLSNKAPLIAIATHDRDLAEKSIIKLKKAGHSNCELEQFFSLPLNGKKLAEKYSVKFRLYIAYGQPYLPYNFKHVFERPAMISWMLKDLLTVQRRNLNFCM